jgi:hypothetical protein
VRSHANSSGTPTQPGLPQRPSGWSSSTAVHWVQADPGQHGADTALGLRKVAPIWEVIELPHSQASARTLLVTAQLPLYMLCFCEKRSLTSPHLNSHSTIKVHGAPAVCQALHCMLGCLPSLGLLVQEFHKQMSTGTNDEGKE